MKDIKLKLKITLVFFLLFVIFSKAQDPNFHIYLAFGQSNMEGMGAIEAQDKVTNPRVMMLQDQTCSNLGRTYGTWYTATPPLGRCWSGLGPADWFGKTMADGMPSTVKIGIVNASVAGCDIALFQKSAPIGRANADIPTQFNGGYAWLLDLAKIAQKSGVIKGIIFHQGETNTNDPNWKYKVQEIVANLKSDLELGDIPFLAGELLQSSGNCCASHNSEIAKIPSVIPNSYVISSAGLPGVDVAHFSSAGYRTFGVRYAQKMLTLVTTSCEPTAIVPSVQVDGGPWQGITTISVATGSTVKLGPQPITGGTWSWNDGSTTREITLSPTANTTMIATYTNTCGATSTQDFSITVNPIVVPPINDRSLSNPNASAEAKALYCYLQSTFGKKILSGQMGSSWGIDELAYLQTNTGKQPAIYGLDYIHQSDNANENKQAIAYWQKGGIPTVMWHWGAPGVGEGYENSKVKINIDNCFIAGTKEYTSFWSELKIKADLLQELRDANVPVIWRPFHELNGGWFWWGMGTPEQFKKLWITMYNYFTVDRELNNLIWVLCYANPSNGAWFPGNQYVDIAGADQYNVGNGPQKSMYDGVVNSIGGNKMPITYHECGIPPNPDQCLSQGAMWSWWMLWHTSYLSDVDKTYLNTVYKHDLVLTLDELPNIMTSCSNSTNPVPIVSITAPANNSSVCSGSTVEISATTSIISGSIIKVDFYDGNTLLASDNESPYSYSWTNPTNGVHTLRAIATSALNVESAYGSVNLTVNTPEIVDTYVQIDGGEWTVSTAVTVLPGQMLKIGPHPVEANGWTWIGPNNFTSTVREISLSPISRTHSGIYTASYSNNGCISIGKVSVEVPLIVSLREGWNLIGCPLTGKTDIQTAFSDVWQYIEVIKDFDSFYLSKNPSALNTLHTLDWGKGYYIKVSEPCILNWINK